MNQSLINLERERILFAPKKQSLPCCALCQMHSVGNYTPKESIEKFIAAQTKEKEQNIDVGISYGTGQTAIFTIVSPGEGVLEKNLIDLGFKYVHSFERRLGYAPVGDLKMYIKNL